MYKQTNSLTQASSKEATARALQTDAAVPTSATITHTLCSYLVLSYHGNSCGSDSSAD